MYKRIISVFVAFTLLFSVSGVFASAEGETDVVKNEIETNYPDLDLTALPGNKPMIIGAIEDIVDETCMYLYIYNPGRENITSGFIDGLSVEAENAEGEKISFIVSRFAFSVIDRSVGSDEGLFWKVRFNLMGYASRLSDYANKHTFSWNNFCVCTSSKNYFNYQNCVFSFDHSGEKTSISYDLSEVVTLDVHHTWYRSKGKVEKYPIYDEIHTVYFSIPDGYTKYYSNLYSVASTYTKKHTTPIIIGTNPFDLSVDPDFVGPLYPGTEEISVLDFINSLSILSRDYEVISESTGMGLKYYYTADFAANIMEGLGISQYDINGYVYNDTYLAYYLYCDNKIENPEDLKVFEEELFAYIESCESNGLNLDLFDSSKYIPWSEKTIDDTFDSISYSTQIKDDYGALVDEYGLWVGSLFWLYRGNNKKIQEICERYLVDVPDKDIEDEPYLLLCDNVVKSDAATLSDQEFSDKYLIHIDDVAEFKEFLNENKNVVIYRFDVAEYYTTEIVFGTQNQTSGMFNSLEDDYRYCVVEQSLYYNFRVIDVTFHEDDTFVSLCVNSHPQNFASDPGLETDDPPIEWDPDVDLIKDDGIRLLIKAAVVIISILVLLYGAKCLLDAVASSGSNKKNE